MLGSLRRAVGVAHAQPVLFALPTGGRLLVGSDSGAWLVRADGSKRLLTGWDDAAWSPFGRYVVATRPNELAALDEDGHVRWTLARPRARLAAWGGTRTDTRIAYVTTSRLHVVAGDGRHDVDAGGLPAAADVRPAWKPGKPFVVGYADTRGRIAAYEPDTGALLWRTPPFPGMRTLEWSRDGTRLLAASSDKVALVRHGILRVVYRGPVSSAALGPHDELAVARSRGPASARCSSTVASSSGGRGASAGSPSRRTAPGCRPVAERRPVGVRAPPRTAPPRRGRARDRRPRRRELPAGAGLVLRLTLTLLLAAAATHAAAPAQVDVQWHVIGRSVEDARCARLELRGSSAHTTVLVVGCIHGNECRRALAAAASSSGRGVPTSSL